MKIMMNIAKTQQSKTRIIFHLVNRIYVCTNEGNKCKKYNINTIINIKCHLYHPFKPDRIQACALGCCAEHFPRVLWIYERDVVMMKWNLRIGNDSQYCFGLSWNTRFAVMWMANWLSNHKGIGALVTWNKSFRR